MPIPFYNTSPPTPSTRNTINTVAVDYGIRDFLLNKNLLPVYPTALALSIGNQLIGEPVLDTMVGTGNITQPFGLPLETEGIFHMEIAILPNKFKNQSSTASALKSIENIQATQGPYGSTDFPNGIQAYPTSSDGNIDNYGLLAKSNAMSKSAGINGWSTRASDSTLMNLYLDVTKQIDMASFINRDFQIAGKQITGYLDQYGSLNFGDGSGGVQAANIIGSVLNGGLGISKGGVSTNFDLRSSLAGRVLGATGIMSDTRLGLIGGQQLALALANNAAFNIQQSLLGQLNVQDNILSLVKGNGLAGFRPNYQITTASSNLGKIADYTSKILGFTLPRSYLTDFGSIFQNENGNAENIARANSMIENTGKGQVMALLSSTRANLAANSDPNAVFRSGYGPGFNNKKGELEITDSFLYAFSDPRGFFIHPLIASDGVIPDMSIYREGKVSESGFKSPEDAEFAGHSGGVGYNNRKISDIAFSWGSEEGNALNVSVDYSKISGNKKSLLVKTQKLFDSAGMKNLVTVKGEMFMDSTQIQTANNNGISKGSGVLSSGMFDLNLGYVNAGTDKAENNFCRSWTTLDRYDKVNKLTRHRELDKTAPYRFQMEGSVLDSNGMPKIAPYVTDDLTKADPKRYMFSIENLAWMDNFQDLLPVEQGPGDLVSGARGRIMWFPPYDIQFNENSNIEWETNKFIGRGEPIYTYNNTERSGTLSFNIIVDHPSYENAFSDRRFGPDDNYIASYFAGCIDPSSAVSQKLTAGESSSIQKSMLVNPQQKTIEPEVAPTYFYIYFPNDTTALPSTYENGLSGATSADTIDYTVYVSGDGIGTYPGGVTGQGPYIDNYNYGLNSGSNGFGTTIVVNEKSFNGWSDPAMLAEYDVYLQEKCPHCVVEVTGFASPQGTASANETLAVGRRDNVIANLKTILFSWLPEDERAARFKEMESHGIKADASSCVTTKDAPTDTLACKSDRKVLVNFRFDNTLASKDVAKPDVVEPTSTKTITTKISNRFYDESKFFEKLTDIDPFVFDTIRQKIRYFHPAFHSTTPEGLNSRLTFLQQCTRQGPTKEEQGANNLAFGRAPVCILRIGDFFNTKIIMESVAIDYEPLVWDLNPEGIGVQPMIASVSMSFKFIGGSTLISPINKLQNALSFNYYANTHVYDPRADYVARDPNKDVTKRIEGQDEGGEEILGYSIKNDFETMGGFRTNEEVTTETNTTPSVNQGATAAVVVNSPTTPQTTPTSTSEDDISRISIFRVDNITNGFTLFFEVKGGGSLSKDYEFRVKLIDNDKINEEIGVGTLVSAGGTQEFDFKYPNGAGSIGLVDGSTYQIITKFDTENKTGKLDYSED